MQVPSLGQEDPPGAEMANCSEESACNAGDPGLIPGLGKLPGERNGNLLPYSCLESPMDKGAWRAPVRVVAKSWTWLNTHTQTGN